MKNYIVPSLTARAEVEPFNCATQYLPFVIVRSSKTDVKVALDGRVKGDDTSLASSTLLADENNRDIFGLVVSYAVKVRTSVSKQFATKLLHLKTTLRWKNCFFFAKILDLDISSWFILASF